MQAMEAARELAKAIQETPEYREFLKISVAIPAAGIICMEMSSCTTIITVPKQNDVAAAARVVFFQYRPYRKGARKEPESAPHDTPISCAMKVTRDFACTIAMTAEITMNTATNVRSVNILLFSSMCFFLSGSMKSSVSVELDASTSDESVDIDAESTRMSTTAMSVSPSPESMVGTMLSKPSAATLSGVLNSRPNPPRK